MSMQYATSIKILTIKPSVPLYPSILPTEKNVNESSKDPNPVHLKVYLMVEDPADCWVLS